MGLAFVMLSPIVTRRRPTPAIGVIYGVMIWSGLLTTVLISPNGQSKMFSLTPATLALSLVGHLIYGGVLGALTPRIDASTKPEPADDETD